jgi:hypothetical protein
MCQKRQSCEPADRGTAPRITDADRRARLLCTVPNVVDSFGHRACGPVSLRGGGSVLVSASTRSITGRVSGGIRDGRVLSRTRPSTPAVMNRSAPDAGLGFAGLAHDGVRSETGGGQKHDPRSPDVLLRAVPITDDRIQSLMVRIGQRNRDSGARAPDSRAPDRKGIPLRDSSVRFYPLESELDERPYSLYKAGLH